MANRNLQEIPKFEDHWSYLYFEYGCIDQHQKSIALHFLNKMVPIPIETLSVLMLGPGTTITHEAIKRISESRCLVAWTGEMGIRFYSAGYTGTYSSKNLLQQAKMWANPQSRFIVAKRMFEKRFEKNIITPETSIEQLRGMEGIRVRKAYQKYAETYQVPWKGRNYNQKKWDYSDPLNRALSAANACLYGIVHAAILACGFSPAIGFIHTGKQLSFVYDIADLYKTNITIPLAFLKVKEDPHQIEKRVRHSCRDTFKKENIMKKIILDLKDVIYGSDYVGEIYNLSEGRDVAVSY